MFAKCAKPVMNRRITNTVITLSRGLADTSKGKRTLRPLRRKAPGTALAPTPAAPLAVEDAWTAVVDKQSGQTYYWNTVTNETTALGAPKPTGELAQQQPQQQSGGMMSGLGRVVAEGFAFGVGSSVAHGIVGSMFGGSSGPSESDAGGDDGFDI